MNSVAVPASGVSDEDHAKIIKQAVSREATHVAREIEAEAGDGRWSLGLHERVSAIIQADREAYAADCVAREVAEIEGLEAKLLAKHIEAESFSNETTQLRIGTTEAAELPWIKCSNDGAQVCPDDKDIIFAVANLKAQAAVYMEALEKISHPTYCSQGAQDSLDVVTHMRAIAKTALRHTKRAGV